MTPLWGPRKQLSDLWVKNDVQEGNLVSHVRLCQHKVCLVQSGVEYIPN